MTIRFNNPYLEALAIGEPLSSKPIYSDIVVKKFRRMLITLTAAESVGEIQKINGLNFEKLRGDRQGFYSVRVDQKYRLILTLEGEDLAVAEILTVEDLTNHYR